MKRCTGQIIRAALAGDSTVRPDQRETAMSILLERGIGDFLVPLLVNQIVAAKLLSVSRSTVFRLVQAGVLHPVRVGGSLRYRVEELREVARGQKT